MSDQLTPADGANAEAELEYPVEEAIQWWRHIMDTLLAVATTDPSPAVRKLALAEWSSGKADEQLIRSLAFEWMVRAAYAADDSEARAYVRTVLVQKGVAAPRDFDRHSCAETLAALPARLAAVGIASPGLVG